MALACVDQPLIPVERNGAGGLYSGGSANPGGSGGGEVDSRAGNGGIASSSESKGGRSAVGGSSSNSSVTCVAKLDGDCSGNQCCVKGLSCGTADKCCKDNEQPCSPESADKCCSGKCVNNFCASRVPMYLTADYLTPCADDIECASRKCDYYHGGFTKVCQSIEGCRPFAESCTSWWQCCSGQCAGGRCQLRASELSSGDLCSPPNAQAGCDDGATCRNNTQEGVSRCYKWRDDCVVANAPCSVGWDCCLGHCLQRENKQGLRQGDDFGTCQACVIQGLECTADFDCCSGLECDLNTNLCAPKITTCGALKAQCSSGSSTEAGGASGNSSTALPPCCFGYLCDAATQKCVMH